MGPLAAGTNPAIGSGEEAVKAPGELVWKRQDVLNNDGDVANLIAPDGALQAFRY